MLLIHFLIKGDRLEKDGREWWLYPNTTSYLMCALDHSFLLFPHLNDRGNITTDCVHIT